MEKTFQVICKGRNHSINPFGKASGSDRVRFIVLDKNNTGVVINFVYTHEGVRVYSKHVILKGKEYPLTPKKNTLLYKVSDKLYIM